MPQRLPVALVERDYIAARLSIEDDDPGLGQHSCVSLTIGRADLRRLPNNLSSLNSECTEIFLSRLLVGLAFFCSAGGQFCLALFQRDDVIETRNRAERSGIPICADFRTDKILLFGALWTAVRTNTASPSRTNEVPSRQNAAIKIGRASCR